MLRTRVIPCLLLKDAGLVKTIEFRDPKYVGDPINAVKMFNDKGVDEIIFLDISATKEKREPSYDLIKGIASEAFMPFSYGGGIKNVEQIKKIFQLGAEKVVINSGAFENPMLIKEASNYFGSQSITVSIDVKDGEVFVQGKKTGISPIEWGKKAESFGAGEIFLNSVDCDGKMNGYDLDFIKKMAEMVSIPIIACGGAGKIGDLKSAVNAGASAVAAGSLFVFIGQNRAVLINYPSEGQLESAGLVF